MVLLITVRDVIRGMLPQGFRKVVMLNSQYENAEFAIAGVAQALEQAPDARALMVMWWSDGSDRRARPPAPRGAAPTSLTRPGRSEGVSRHAAPGR
jgi:isochorismate hydrolase